MGANPGRVVVVPPGDPPVGAGPGRAVMVGDPEDPEVQAAAAEMAAELFSPPDP